LHKLTLSPRFGSISTEIGRGIHHRQKIASTVVQNLCSALNPGVPFACFGQASLFPFHHPGIPSHKLGFSKDGVDLGHMRDDALSDTMRNCTCLASRAPAANDREHVKCTERTSKLEWTHDAFAVGGCNEELV